jgi:hypothetical protein
MMYRIGHLSFARLCELGGAKVIADPKESEHLSDCGRCTKFLQWFAEDQVGVDESQEHEEQDDTVVVE